MAYSRAINSHWFTLWLAESSAVTMDQQILCIDWEAKPTYGECKEAGGPQKMADKLFNTCELKYRYRHGEPEPDADGRAAQRMFIASIISEFMGDVEMQFLKRVDTKPLPRSLAEEKQLENKLDLNEKVKKSINRKYEDALRQHCTEDGIARQIFKVEEIKATDIQTKGQDVDERYKRNFEDLIGKDTCEGP